jgi:hypothetical protein
MRRIAIGDRVQRIEIVEGDITTLELDAIVNAANPWLLGGVESMGRSMPRRGRGWLPSTGRSAAARPVTPSGRDRALDLDALRDGDRRLVAAARADNAGGRSR